jgi:peptidoglycan/xylan/chitin deacetylase (PgdA/CDA1 family)
MARCLKVRFAAMYKRLRSTLTACAMLVAGMTAAQTPAPVLDEIVANFRRMIVLHEAAGRSRELTQAGQYLFFRNRELAAQTVAGLLAPPVAASEQRIVALIDFVASRKDWRDVDKLALLGVINETRARLPAGSALAVRLGQVRDEIAAIRAVYNSEITATLTDRPRAARSRPGWDAYVAFLHEQYPLVRVLEELHAQLPAPSQRATPSSKGEAIVESARRDEWNDGGLPPKTLLLTFDDGPHPRYTAEILRILDYYKLKAIFFQVGRNLGALRDGQAGVLHNTPTVDAILRAGHAVANHTYTHPFLPRLDVTQVETEIDTTQALLLTAAPGPGRAPLFRPPYGARNPLVLAEVADRGLRSVIWNIDSRDWADPIPQSIAQRVFDEAEREGRGIILFHDIHGRTVQALPRVIEGLLKRGFRFAHWDGIGLSVDEGK